MVARSWFVSAEHGQVSLPFMGTPPTIELGSLGMADSLILMVLALVVFGPRRLPQIGRQIGKLMFEFRKASNDFKFQMEEELRASEDAERRKKEEEQRKQLALTQPAQESVSATPVVVNAIESPHQGEANLLLLVTEPVPQAEEPALRVQPPSTGETVAVLRRSELAGQTEPPADAAYSASSDSAERAVTPDESRPVPDAAKQESPPATEAVRHNG
jgi:sec-independent protein translocase protein TatB